MITVTENGSIEINLHNTMYTLSATDTAAFKADLYRGAYALALVEKYLDKLVRLVKRVSAAARIAALDAYNYACGLGAPTFWQEQRLRWRN